MFDIGWTEILVIVAVAVIVVGPKDIPKMLKTIGKYLRKAKTMMRDVRRQVEEVADIAEIKELKATAESIKKDMGVDSFDDPMKMSTPSKASTETTTEPLMTESAVQETVKEKPKPTPKRTAKAATKKTVVKKTAVKKPTTKKPTARKTTKKPPVKKVTKTASS